MEVCMQSPQSVLANSEQDRRGQSERSQTPVLVHYFVKYVLGFLSEREVKINITLCLCAKGLYTFSLNI